VMESTIVDLESDLNDNSEVIARVSGELETKIAAFDALGIEHEGVKLMLVSANDEASAFLIETNEKVECLMSRIGDLESCAEGHKANIDSHEVEKESLIGELNISRESVKNLEFCVEENEVSLRQGEGLRMKLEEDICAKEERIEELQEQCEAGADRIETLEDEISELEVKIVGMEEVLVKTSCEFESKIEEYVESVQSHLGSIEALKGDVVGLETEISRLGEVGEGLKINLDESDARNIQLDGDVETLKGNGFPY
jgi:chromosome segregation ATPase